MNVSINLKNFLFWVFPLLLSSINKHKHTDHKWLLSKSWSSGFYGHLFKTHMVRVFVLFYFCFSYQ